MVIARKSLLKRKLICVPIGPSGQRFEKNMHFVKKFFLKSVDTMR